MKPIVKIIITILLILCLGHMPYGFYTLVRFVAAFAFAYFAYYYFKAGKETSIRRH